MIRRKTIAFENEPQSLNWRGDLLVDWVGGGSLYSLDGEYERGGRIYSYRFDAAIQSDNGVYTVIYEKLGTKGVILKNGEMLRELNRSFYHATAYEYPITFLKLPNGEYALIHCPNEYCQIEVELADTGEKITTLEGRKPEDCFHSRFRVNQSNSVLLNAGWVWHPYGILQLYDIAKGIDDTSVFDKTNTDFPTNAEVCSAEFLTDDLLVVSATAEEPLDEEELNDPISLHPGQIGLYCSNEIFKEDNREFQSGNPHSP